MPKIAHPSEFNNTQTTIFGTILGQGRRSGGATPEHRNPTLQQRPAVYTRVVDIDDGRIGVESSAAKLDKPNQLVLHLPLRHRRTKFILADGANQPRHGLPDLNAEESKATENGGTASGCGRP